MTEDELVSLVIHEMSHATVYFPGDSNFNESYASFVEEEGTELFYRAHNSDKGGGSFTQTKKRKLQSDIIISKVKETAFKLKAMYEREDITDMEKLEQKKKLLKSIELEILANADKFSNFNPEKFKRPR